MSKEMDSLSRGEKVIRKVLNTPESMPRRDFLRKSAVVCAQTGILTFAAGIGGVLFKPRSREEILQDIKGSFIIPTQNDIEAMDEVKYMKHEEKTRDKDLVDETEKTREEIRKINHAILSIQSQEIGNGPYYLASISGLLLALASDLWLTSYETDKKN